MRAVPKATKGTGGNRYQNAPVRENDSGVEISKPTKTDIIKQAGFTPKQVERFQTLAANPDIAHIVPQGAKCF